MERLLDQSSSPNLTLDAGQVQGGREHHLTPRTWAAATLSKAEVRAAASGGP